MTKYRAKPVVIDNIRFASQKEGRRYQELRLLEKAGAINSLELQPKFPLVVEGKKIAEYRGDFAYQVLIDGGYMVRIVEDVKGMDTPVSRLKRKHVAAQYGIEVRIV